MNKTCANCFCCVLANFTTKLTVGITATKLPRRNLEIDSLRALQVAQSRNTVYLIYCLSFRGWSARLCWENGCTLFNHTWLKFCECLIRWRKKLVKLPLTKSSPWKSLSSSVPHSSWMRWQKRMHFMHLDLLVHGIRNYYKPFRQLLWANKYRKEVLQWVAILPKW